MYLTVTYFIIKETLGVTYTLAYYTTFFLYKMNNQTLF